jgi:hypothetical protein
VLVLGLELDAVAVLVIQIEHLANGTRLPFE